MTRAASHRTWQEQPYTHRTWLEQPHIEHGKSNLTKNMARATSHRTWQEQPHIEHDKSNLTHIEHG